MITNLNKTIGSAKHFTWTEATKKGKLQPINKTIHKNICTTASYLERIRAILGNKPIIISSWYRTHKYNNQIGGAKNSQHLLGLAVDFHCKHLSPDEIYDILDTWHDDNGGLGRYPNHIHIDLRGIKTRWFKDSY